MSVTGDASTTAATAVAAAAATTTTAAAAAAAAAAANITIMMYTIYIHNRSTLGFYRGGGAIGFDGVRSRGTIAAAEVFDSSLRDGLTIGLVVHPVMAALQQKQAEAAVLWEQPGVFELSLNTSSGVLSWAVRVLTNTTSGILDNTQKQQVASTTGLLPRGPVPPEGFAVKCTYNTTSGAARIFLGGKPLPAAQCCQPQLAPPDSSIARAAAVSSPMYIGATNSSNNSSVAGSADGTVRWSRYFHGALEELYIKNTSTENRPAYVFADDCRSSGTFLMDLATDAGRMLFVNQTARVLNLANFSDVQFDGFEKLQLISRVDFAHSNATFDSSLYLGHITPGHYHLPWPLKVGQGILQAIEETHAQLDPSLAVELSFMASGLGPWRPAMNTYVDEKVVRHNTSNEGPDGYVLLGLQWHGKLAQRTELTGMAINAYNMVIDPQDPKAKQNDRLIHSQFELDYFLGGLITIGVGPQPISKSHVVGKYDSIVRGWIQRYYRYGHLLEGAIQTLHVEEDCCHVQGLCQWVVCADVVAVGLGGGQTGGTVLSLYAGAPNAVTIPSKPFIPAAATSATLLIFVAHGVNGTTVAIGSVGGHLHELHVVLLSPLSSGASVTLRGGFFSLKGENIRLTVKSEAGAVVSSSLLWAKAQTGPREWSASIGKWESIERPTLLFQKVAAATGPEHDAVGSGGGGMPGGSISGAPFAPVRLAQPVPGAARAWRVVGKLCDVTQPPYLARGDNRSDDTFAIQRAIDDCGDLAGSGGTVLLPSGHSFVSGSLWLRSNLTFLVERGAALIGSPRFTAYNMTYTRSGCTMMMAHAALLNAGRCLRLKEPLVGWDDCAEWSMLQNLVVSGGGEINGRGDQWWSQGGCLPTCPDGTDTGQRPTLLGLLWVDGLTISNLTLRHPAFWTVHPCFSNNVRIVGNDIFSNGHGTDGIDLDSSWNVYVSDNTISTRDDDIALKAGKDWSGRMVNISTRFVVIEGNRLAPMDGLAGHGIAFGSETSGWIRDVVVRDMCLNGVEALVRMKSMRGRGGGVERVMYENVSGVVEQAIQITLEYHKKSTKTNASATPIVRDIFVRNVAVTATTSAILCDGLPDSPITNLTLANVSITGVGSTAKQVCDHCDGAFMWTHPKLCIKN